jgi:hypothetical protein
MSETFLIIRRIERDVVINVLRPSCKVAWSLFLSDLNEVEFSRQVFEKYSNIKFHENHPLEPSCSCGRTDGQTDMTKLIVPFLNYSKVLNKESVHTHAINNDKATVLMMVCYRNV